MAILCGVTLLFGTRQKFFYYATAFTIDKSIVGLFKLIYYYPRPFMASTALKGQIDYIYGIKCSSEFGNPSGHSLSSALFSIMLFLDVFHDESKSFRRRPLTKSEIKSRTGFWKCNYYIWLVLASYWAISIPITRYVLGVHSLDQIIYGSSLGIWAGLTCHFILRDVVLTHVKRIIHQKAKYL